MHRRSVLVLSVAFSVASSASAQVAPAGSPSPAPNSSASSAAPSSAGDATAPLITEAFTIGPGDLVRVRIWREPSLDGDFQVDEAGRLTLPLLGTRTVTGIAWLQLRDSLLNGYRRELKAPAVTLTPLRRVYVLGEVNRPGVYLADPTLSLAGIVALAGGASPLGDLGKLRVVRQGQTIVERAAIEEQLVRVGIRSEDQVFVDRRNWFELNSTFVASAAISIATILVTFLRR